MRAYRYFVRNLLPSLLVKKNLKVGQHLPKPDAEVEWDLFSGHGVYWCEGERASIVHLKFLTFILITSC